jgi:phospholipase C
MRFVLRLLIGCLFLTLPACGGGGSKSTPSIAVPPQFGKIEHVVFIVQENHTFDSIFGGPNPFPGADTASSGKNSNGITVPLQPQPMGDSGGATGLSNSYPDWANSCDVDPSMPLQVGVPRPCRLDGFDKVGEKIVNPNDTAYAYAEYSQTTPYFDIAHKYALGDHFFASHNSESYTAHQYIFAGQSGFPGTVDAPYPNFPGFPAMTAWNCSSGTIGEKTYLWDPNVTTLSATVTGPIGPYPCWTYPSLADLLNAKSTSWRVYIPFTLFDVNSLASMRSIYQNPKYWPPNCPQPPSLTCANTAYFRANLATFLTDYGVGGTPKKYQTLPGVTWFLAPLYDSDHPLGVQYYNPAVNPTAPTVGLQQSMGPNWVATIVDAIGNSPDWSTTAIFIFWDDWGGYYDHVQPYVVRDAAGVGFRVPLMIVSPYTKPGCILKTNTEFGTLLKFTEDTFLLGSLGTNTVDQSPFINNLSACFDWSHPRPFVPVTGAMSTQFWQERFGSTTQPSAKDQIRDE